MRKRLQNWLSPLAIIIKKQRGWRLLRTSFQKIKPYSVEKIQELSGKAQKYVPNCYWRWGKQLTNVPIDQFPMELVLSKSYPYYVIKNRILRFLQNFKLATREHQLILLVTHYQSLITVFYYILLSIRI